MVTQQAKDLAERRPKNNIHTSIGTNKCFNCLAKLVPIAQNTHQHNLNI